MNDYKRFVKFTPFLRAPPALDRLQWLFASGAVVGEYWQARSQWLTQNSSGTGLVTAPGDVVGRWAGVSGRYSAIQETTANKPVFAVLPTSRASFLLADSTDVLSATLPALGSCTVARLQPDGVVWSVETISDNYQIALSNRYNSDICVIQGSPSADIVALVESAMRNNLPTLGQQLIPNGTFDSGTSGWTAGAGTIASVAGELVVTATVGGNGPRAVATVAGVLNAVYFAKLTGRSGTSPHLPGLRLAFDATTYLTTTIAAGTESDTARRVFKFSTGSEISFQARISTTSASAGTCIFDNAFLGILS